MRRKYFSLGHDCFFTYLLQFIIYWLFYLLHYVAKCILSTFL